MNHHTLSADQQLNNLIAFRQASYGCLVSARDALFELSDAVLLTPQAPSLAHLSLSPIFRRRWPSVYAALQDGAADSAALLGLYSRHVQPLTGDPPRVLLAGDNTAWPRPLARTLAERTYLHQAAVLPSLGGRPVTAGHGYSTVAWVPQPVGSWALPLLHERVRPSETALGKAAAQLTQARASLPAALEVVALYDSQYGCAPFVQATAAVPADKILRLRPNLRLFEAPPPYQGRGRYPKHGAPFKLADPATWGNTDELLWVDDPQQGWVQVQVWHNLHFRAAATIPLSLARLSRPGARGTRRDPKAQWLAWVGAGGRRPPPVEEWWALYGRRFALDHWYRFAKQRLHWTRPQVGAPRAGEVWSGLMPLVSWELWLGRGVVSDRPLPWQKAGRRGELTPGRVAAGMGAVIAAVGTPAGEPKRRGKSPGWPVGRARRRRERCPVLKKPSNPAQRRPRRGRRAA